MPAKRSKRHRPHEVYTFKVLNGPTYDEADRPPLWSNPAPLCPPHYAEANPPVMDSLPLESFPLIEDFEVRLEMLLDAQGVSPFGYQIGFFSETYGELSSFPWWDHAERGLVRPDFAIPLGTFEAPYYDLEQGWEIVIAARGILVYVLQGQFDQREVDGYRAWYKVQKTRYVDQWRAAIAASRQLTEETWHAAETQA